MTLASHKIVAVIDDEHDLVYLFQEALRQIKNIQVITFTDPNLALEHFQMNHHQYLVVISDLRMPQIDGLTLLKKMWEINPSVTRILISAFEIRDELWQKSHYVNKFLQKPISVIDLVKQVERLVTKPNLEA